MNEEKLKEDKYTKETCPFSTTSLGYVSFCRTDCAKYIINDEFKGCCEKMAAYALYDYLKRSENILRELISISKHLEAV